MRKEIKLNIWLADIGSDSGEPNPAIAVAPLSEDLNKLDCVFLRQVIFMVEIDDAQIKVAERELEVKEAARARKVREAGDKLFPIIKELFEGKGKE